MEQHTLNLFLLSTLLLLVAVAREQVTVVVEVLVDTAHLLQEKLQEQTLLLKHHWY
jgi:hypothetical protein